MKNQLASILLFAISGCVTETKPIEKTIPILAYSPPPAGADISRMMHVVWMDCSKLRKDPYGTSEPAWADNFSEQMDKLSKAIMEKPKGQRAVMEWHCASSAWLNQKDTLLYHPLDGTKETYEDFLHRKRPFPFPDFKNGLKVTADKFKFLFSELKKRGTDIDYFSSENEQIITPWAFQEGQAKAYENDPRFKELAKELGFSDLSTVMDFRARREDFNTLSRVLYFKSLEAFLHGMYEPIWSVYPNLKDASSDYAKFSVGDNRVYEPNGWELWKSQPKIPLPMHGTDLNYLGCSGLCVRNGNDETGPFPNTPWNTFILSLNQARGIVLANPKDGFWPFLGPASWENNHPCYEEHIKHLALLMNQKSGFVFWNPDPLTTVEDYAKINRAMKEVDSLLGFSDRTSLVAELISWQAKEITTCAKANGKLVCRVTKNNCTGFWN